MGAACDEQVFGPELLEDGLQVSAIEATVARLVEDEVARLGHQFGQNFGVPGIPDEDAGIIAGVWLFSYQ
jgi:hypothetical protein